MSDPASENTPSERSTFLQQTLERDPISDGWLFFPALAVGVVVAIYAGSWQTGLLVGVATYVGAGLTYTITAAIFGWRRIRWMAFVGTIIEVLGVLRWF